MDDEKRIVPYRKAHHIGDGDTRFTEAWEQPRTGEEKYQPAFGEACHNFEVAVSQFNRAVIEAMQPVMDHLVRSLAQIAALYEQANPPTDDPKAEARRRIRDDVARKRRELWRRR